MPGKGSRQREVESCLYVLYESTSPAAPSRPFCPSQTASLEDRSPSLWLFIMQLVLQAERGVPLASGSTNRDQVHEKVVDHGPGSPGCPYRFPPTCAPRQDVFWVFEPFLDGFLMNEFICKRICCLHQIRDSEPISLLVCTAARCREHLPV